MNETRNTDQASEGHATGTGNVPFDVELIAGILHFDVSPNNPEGFTFCPRTLSCLFETRPADTSLYVVSVDGHCLCQESQPTLEEISLWISPRVALLERPGYYIGGWRDGKVFYLDLSLIVQGHHQAMTLGRLNRQKTIYHPATGRVIEVTRSLSESTPETTRKHQEFRLILGYAGEPPPACSSPETSTPLEA